MRGKGTLKRIENDVSKDGHTSKWMVIGIITKNVDVFLHNLSKLATKSTNLLLVVHTMFHKRRAV